MIHIHFFFRFKNPLFFSIEKVFEGISGQIIEQQPALFEVKKVFMPVKNGGWSIPSHLRFTRRNQGDINHITGDIHYAILACSSKQVNILTIHDCVLLKNRNRLNLTFWIFKWFWYDLPVRKADVVTVISENTKKELIQFTGCDPNKVITIPNFISDLYCYQPKLFNDRCPKILFIGTTPNKNIFRLAMALTEISCELEIVGKLSDDQEKALTENKILFKISEQLTEEQLLRKYIECDILTFPTTYEGFGLPIIEAQAVGRPVLTSLLSPMKEVAGDAASYCDPYSIDSIRNAINRIIKEPDFRNSLVMTGLENVKQYRIAEVTKQYSDLYQMYYRKKVRPGKETTNAF